MSMGAPKYQRYFTLDIVQLYIYYYEVSCSLWCPYCGRSRNSMPGPKAELCESTPWVGRVLTITLQSAYVLYILVRNRKDRKKAMGLRAIIGNTGIDVKHNLYLLPTDTSPNRWRTRPAEGHRLHELSYTSPVKVF